MSSTLSNQSLSSLLGWISFSCWLLVYTPQIYENYQRKSGEGVSIYLIIIWMLGDLANLFGTIKQHLLRTMIFLSVYYTACDLVLLLQIYYYRHYPSKPISIEHLEDSIQPSSDPEDGRVNSDLLDEQTPLLVPMEQNSEQIPSERNINNQNSWTCKYFINTLSYIQKYCSEGLASYVGTYALIVVIGFLGWFISQRTEHRNTEVLPPTGEYDEGRETWDLTAQILGWISALAYISSRLPQIFKNQQTKCRGLSLLFFLIGITGNLTYFSSILMVDRSLVHLMINLSWLVGSGGTIFLDLIVLYQFWIYRHERDSFAIALAPDHVDQDP